MPAKPADLWTYATGRIGSTVATAGTSLRSAIERFNRAGRDGTPDFEREGLLSNAPDRDAREGLLRELHSAGVPLEELRGAVNRDRLALVPVEGVLQGDGEYTLQELAAQSGVRQQLLARWFGALGFTRASPSSKFNGDALAAAQALSELQEAGLPEASIEELCRLAGSRVGNIARGAREVFRQVFIEPETTERELGLRYAAAARRMLPVFEPLLRFTLTMSLLNLVRSDIVTHAQRISGGLPGGHHVAVCFADLAGFTRLTEALPPEEIGAMIKQFEALVREHTPPAARHVKTIGDGAMIVTDDTSLALGAAQGLVDAAETTSNEFPPIHAGVAVGTAINSGGDWYGQPINLASRLADCAPPGQVYAAEEVAELMAEQFTLVGTRRLSGIGHAVPVFALERATGR